MSLSNTGGHGRGGQEGRLIGDGEWEWRRGSCNNVINVKYVWYLGSFGDFLLIYFFESVLMYLDPLGAGLKAFIDPCCKGTHMETQCFIDGGCRDRQCPPMACQKCVARG